MAKPDEIGALARKFAEAERDNYPPIATAADKLALVAAQGELEFCCKDAETEPVIWCSWYPWRVLCEAHAMAAQAAAGGAPEMATAAGLHCDSCGRGPLRDMRIETVNARLNDQVVIVAMLCDRCPGPPGSDEEG